MTTQANAEVVKRASEILQAAGFEATDPENPCLHQKADTVVTVEAVQILPGSDPIAWLTFDYEYSGFSVSLPLSEVSRSVAILESMKYQFRDIAKKTRGKS